ncbi:MAG: hypothetical protein ACYDEB_11090 [Dehalococcoidia bacterium]
MERLPGDLRADTPPARVSEGGTTASHPTSSAPEHGCLYDVLGFTAPVLLLLVAIGVFALVWALRGNTHRAGFGAAGIAFYGGTLTLFGYLPYGIGYAVFRMAALATSTRTVLYVAGSLLAGALAAGSLCIAIGAVPAAVIVEFFAGVPALAGVAACLAQVAARRSGVPPKSSA